MTGSHRDIAAIDCVTYAALDRFEPDLTRGLRIALAQALADPLRPATGRRCSSPR